MSAAVNKRWWKTSTQQILEAFRGISGKLKFALNDITHLPGQALSLHPEYNPVESKEVT